MMRQKGSTSLLIIIAIVIIGLVYFAYTRGYIILNLPKNLTTVTNPRETVFEDKTLKVNYYPVELNHFTLQQQKLAQTFTLDKSLTVKTVTLKASFGVGNSIFLNIYEAGNIKELTDGNLVASGSFKTENIVKLEPFDIILDKPVQFEANKMYVMVISTNDDITQTGIAFVYDDIFSNGKMYTFERLTGGNGEILDNNHNWRPENSQDVLYTFKEL